MKVYQDVFVEQLVRRQRPGGENLFKLGAILLGLLLIGVAFVFAKAFFAVSFAVVVILEFFAFVYTVKEYEYSFINGEVDVDKILGRRKRTTVYSGNCRDIVRMAPCAGNETALQGEFTRTLDVSCRAGAEDRWFFLTQRQDGSRELVLLSPNQRMLEAFKGYLGKRMEYSLPTPHTDTAE